MYRVLSVARRSLDAEERELHQAFTAEVDPVVAVQVVERIMAVGQLVCSGGEEPIDQRGNVQPVFRCETLGGFASRALDS